MKLVLANALRRQRVRKRWTQTHVAKRLGSSQSRVAKMEAADPSVSLDLLVRALIALGTSKAQLGKILARSPVRKAA